MHVPVYNVQHQFVGSLGGAVFLKQLSQTLGKIRFAQTGYASLQDNNGTIIFSHKPKNIGKNYFSPYIQNQPGANLVQLNKAIYSARKGVTSNVTYVTTGAVTKIATVIPVTITPGHRWIIIVSVPKTEIAQTFIHSGLNNSFNVVLAILAIVILIVVGALIATNFAAYKLQLAKDQFISLVSHQLRTPLTSIRLFSEMLSDPRVGKLNEKQHEYVDKVHLSTIRMISLVGDILNVSRIELKRLKVEPIETNLVEYLNTCIAEVQPIADEKKIKITTHIPEHPINLKVDQTLFGQIVHNLLTNAVRYTAEEDGEVDVTLKKISRGGIELTVSDNGIGIPEKSQKKIFERFYRADNAVKTIGDGTGLGLYLIKMILNTTGGKIWFESKENKGSTFHVTIPKTGLARNTVVRKKK
jgi:signal transduction histidine kinase